MVAFDSGKTVRELEVAGRRYAYYGLRAAEELGLEGASRLPFTLKVLLENLLRQHAEGAACAHEIQALVDWLKERRSLHEIGFRPARVMMPDSSGIPLIGDLAAMRDAMVRLGSDPQRINPLVPVDFIIDHAVAVDHSGTREAAERNIALEIERNRERYEFLRWGQQAFANLRLIPPGSGICHQINLEYLAQVVATRDEGGRTLAYPDSVLGMDSHTPMVNGLGVIGWGVGGLAGGAAALGEAIPMQIPEVIGCRLTGKLAAGVTSTDLVLTVTQVMRGHKVVGKFVEFFGPGVDALTIPDRATIANMSPEYGTTMGFFPVDHETLRYLTLTGRDPRQVALVEAYSKTQGMWRDAKTPLPDYTNVIEIDLSAIEPCVSGPKRPHERVALSEAPAAFRAAYAANGKTAKVEGAQYALKNGDVVIAAITSCTNTSNPSAMMSAGLLARNALTRGLKPKPWVKTSLAPGSRVVTDYLAASGLKQPLDELGFNIVGYGCMTCMGNSGPLPEAIAKAIGENDLAAVAVLSGNRNFEGRIHPHARANFLASPPLVVAYALAGSILTDLSREPLGTGAHGESVFLKDIWPDPAEVRSVIESTLAPALFRKRYATITEGTPEWNAIAGAGGTTFAWKSGSTFIRRPPFLERAEREPAPVGDLRGARILAVFGDMLTTDHISPIGTISPGTAAAKYLESLGVEPRDFVTYAARRLNHDVMARGTFANIRIRNEMLPGVEGGKTRHWPSGDTLSIFDAAERYRRENVPLVVVAGAQYGAGSSRDWAAKGTQLLGVHTVIAESFERIHRSNLIDMGVLPLEFPQGETRGTLELDGAEVIDICGLAAGVAPRQELQCTLTRRDGSRTAITLLARLDTPQEVEYYRHGGVLQHVLRKRLQSDWATPA